MSVYTNIGVEKQNETLKHSDLKGYHNCLDSHVVQWNKCTWRDFTVSSDPLVLNTNDNLIHNINDYTSFKACIL